MARGKKLPKWLTEDEQKALLRVPNRRYRTGLRNLCILRVMLGAGLRAGEVVALRKSHINMQSGKVTVREGKGAKDRVVWIDDETRDLIGAWLERRPRSDWLFCTLAGGQLYTSYMRQMVKRYAQKAGIPEWEKVSPHVLRHTFATDLLKETGNIRMVQKALGHADLSTTMIYTHVVDGELEAAMKGLRATAA